MISLNIKFDEEVKALLILCSFPESWNRMVMMVINFVFDSNTLKFDDVVGVILSEEIRRKISSSTSTSSSVLNAESRGRSKERETNSRGHGKS